MKYGKEFKNVRLTHGRSQTQVARATGISQQNISNWENDVYLPNIDFCVKLADYYEISLDELVGRVFHEKEK